MNEKEIKLFYETLDILNKVKLNHPKSFNNTKSKFLLKDERYIYIDDGIDNILNGLLNHEFNSFEEAKTEYNNSLKYLDNNDLITILSNGKEQLLSFD